MGKATIGTDASGGNLYINLDGLDPRNGDRIIGNWYFKDTTIGGTMYMYNNTSIWLQKGYTTDGNSRPTPTESAGQILEFTVFAYKA